jgi:hypothetical protein
LLCLHSNWCAVKLEWLKYLLVFVLVFSILERSGIMVSAYFAKAHQADEQPGSDDERTATDETKETTFKEFWVFHQNAELPALYTCSKQTAYPHEESARHLAWVSPVPTPPPDFLI